MKFEKKNFLDLYMYLLLRDSNKATALWKLVVVFIAVPMSVNSFL